MLSQASLTLLIEFFSQVDGIPVLPTHVHTYISSKSMQPSSPEKGEAPDHCENIFTE